MNISARNAFKGKITSITGGAVNAEVELTTDGGDKIVAIITEGSVKSLGLAIGKGAVALVKAPWVIVTTGQPGMRFSTRNQLSGKVASLVKGAVNTDVKIELAGGSLVHAIITNEAAQVVGLRQGVAATALIKASHVILGVPA